MTPLLSLALAACLAVGAGSDHILAGDLVSAYPAMASLDPATPVVHAPEPGVSRVFRSLDLRPLAARFNLEPPDPATEFCVERPVAPLDPARLMNAMQAVLPEARISVMEYSRQPAPAGTVEFTRDGLHEGTARSGSLWMGAVRYGATRRFPIWARVQVAMKLNRVLALGDLRPEQPIQPGQVIEEQREEFPKTGDFAASRDQVAGRWPRISIRAGSEIRMDQLIDPKAVGRGERVRVEVVEGGAHLEFDGIAESSGSAGETIPVRNPENGHRFRARVEGKGRVSVGAAPLKVTS